MAGYPAIEAQAGEIDWVVSIVCRDGTPSSTNQYKLLDKFYTNSTLGGSP